MYALLLTSAIAAIAATTPASHAAADTQRVAFPSEPAEAPCARGGAVQVVGFSGSVGGPAAFAERELSTWLASGSHDMLLVLGADTRALWVLEAYLPSDACTGPDCSRVVLREIRFDGDRYGHNLTARRDERDDMPLADVLSKRLQAWQILSGQGVGPVDFQLNHAQQAPGRDGLSSWALRVRDSVHKSSFVWRRRMTEQTYWCSTSYELSTYRWSQRAIADGR
jgi:hypothetical protein